MTAMHIDLTKLSDELITALRLAWQMSRARHVNGVSSTSKLLYAAAVEQLAELDAELKRRDPKHS